ncbi:AMP-binding protein [Pseudoduganella sp. UC29_106]|uniref:AMP-binding protein n=1 Tax=Pseudoduganella sp. UC29_106 TaxID=3374553 RepID=UPI0037580850
MAAPSLLLDYVYDREASHPERIYLTQPIGGGKVIDYTWGQALDEARRMASHLQQSGVGPGIKVAILSKNCAHFIIAELAIWMAGGATVAIFATETAANVRFVLEHSEASLLLVGKLDSWAQQAAGVPEDMRRIALPLAPAGAGEDWSEIIARTPPIKGRPVRGADEMAILVYTSGSTGQPKGVIHHFGNMTAATTVMVDMGISSESDRMLSYLPLAHVMERVYIECSSFVAGFRIFFAESLDTFIADLQRARPTLFLSVPRLWTKFQLGVFSHIPPKRLDLLLRLPVVGKLVSRKILAGLGLDQVRLAGSGSAPLPNGLIEWYRRLGLNLIEGYGMSEDFSLSHVSDPEHARPGYVGRPFPGVLTRIADDGELLIKSPGCFHGYYKLPELNAECFTEDGYFRTGDLGEYSDDGLLRITGRKKELFKTAKGKYVAPAPIESYLCEHPMLELAMVSGAGQAAAYALVELKDELRDKINDPATRSMVEQALGRHLEEVNARLANCEKLQMLVVAHEHWSIENGCLTPTMKIKRSRIEEGVSASLDSWYARKAPIVWAEP